MRRIAIIALALTLAAPALAAERSRTLTQDFPAAGVASVTLRGGVGDIEIIGADDVTTVSVTVEIHAKGSFWRSHRGDDALADVKLEPITKGSSLSLELSGLPDGDDRDFSEDWTVKLPRRLAIQLKFGVGDVRVTDMKGDVGIEVGVGDIRIEGSYADFGTIEGRCGVGDVDLRTPDGRKDGSGFISSALREKGPGSAQIDVRAGVGDVNIKLR